MLSVYVRLTRNTGRQQCYNATATVDKTRESLCETCSQRVQLDGRQGEWATKHVSGTFV